MLKLIAYGVRGLKVPAKGQHDPYILFAIGGSDVVPTTRVDNKSDPSWHQEPVSITLLAEHELPFSLNLQVFDSDKKSEDDLLGSGTVKSVESSMDLRVNLAGAECEEETHAGISWEVIVEKTEPYQGFGWLGNPSKYERLLKEQDQFLEEYFRLAKAQAETFDTELAACCLIQRVWRGTLARLRMFERSFAALNVQRIWRGFMGRLEYAQRLIVAQRKARLAYYDAKATSIQKIVRGFRSRKTKHDFYARAKFLESVTFQNATVRTQLEEHYERQVENVMTRQLEDARSDFARLISDKHHLVSTVSMPGVFNSPFPGMQPTVFGEYVDDHLRRTVESLGNRSLPKIRPSGHMTDPAKMSGKLNPGSLQAASPYNAVDEYNRTDRRVSSAVRAKVSPYEFRPTRSGYAVPHPPSVHVGPQVVRNLFASVFRASTLYRFQMVMY